MREQGWHYTGIYNLSVEVPTPNSPGWVSQCLYVQLESRCVQLTLDMCIGTSIECVLVGVGSWRELHVDEPYVTRRVATLRYDTQRPTRQEGWANGRATIKIIYTILLYAESLESALPPSVTTQPLFRLAEFSWSDFQSGPTFKDLTNTSSSLCLLYFLFYSTLDCNFFHNKHKRV